MAGAATAVSNDLPPRIERFRLELVDRIPCHPPEQTHRAELDALPLADLMSVYVHWAQRGVRPASRWTVHSPDFWTPKALANRNAIRTLEAKLALGEDVSPHLSRRAQTDGYPARRREARSIDWGKMDMALNAWGVHHLHLHPRRTDELLFVAIARDQAAFLLLGDHRSFHSGEVEAAVVAWRAAAGGYELKGIQPDANPLSAAQRTALVRGGVATAASVDGKVILSGIVSSAGTSLRAGVYADRIVGFLRDSDPLLDQGPLSSMISPERLLRLRGREWSWQMDGCDLVLKEAATPITFVALAGPN